ncbi:MAG: cytochrome P450 [Limisphaerales bacterium]|jgi:cytochrome P450
MWPVIPIGETIRNVRTAVKSPPIWFDRLIEKYGDAFHVVFPNGNKLLVTSNPELIRHVFQSGHKNFTKTPVQTVNLADVLGKGLLTSEGEYWLRQRRLIQPGFHREKLSALIEVMHQQIDLAIPELNQAAKSGQIIDLSNYMMKLTFNIVSACLFTTAVTGEELKIIEETIDIGNNHVVNTLRKPWMIPWYKVSGKYKEVYQKRDQVNQILNRAFQERKKSKEQKNDLLQMLLDARYEDSGLGMSDTQLRDETIVLYAAGHETSANGLSWLFWLVSEHADAENNLLSELNGAATDRPGFSELPGLSYSNQTVMEGLRMRPPAWAVDRLCIQDHQFDGKAIANQQSILMYIYGSHKNKNYWENPESFDPDRFSPARYGKEQKKAFIPFGAGPRQCIGYSFAQMEMQLVLLRLFKEFRFEYAGKTKPILQPLITLQPKEGMPMRVYNR